MKKLITIVLILALAILLVGCTQQERVYSMGGSMTVYLEPNVKLEEVTWKDESNLWYLTRPMTNEDVATTHTFAESSSYGIFEGTIYIIETKFTDEEMAAYKEYGGSIEGYLKK